MVASAVFLHCFSSTIYINCHTRCGRCCYTSRLLCLWSASMLSEKSLTVQNEQRLGRALGCGDCKVSLFPRLSCQTSFSLMPTVLFTSSFSRYAILSPLGRLVRTLQHHCVLWLCDSACADRTTVYGKLKDNGGHPRTLRAALPIVCLLFCN